MTEASFGGMGPWGPVRSFVHIVNGRRQIPLVLLRFLCTSHRDENDLYSDSRSKAEARIQRRMDKYIAKNANADFIDYKQEVQNEMHV